MVSQYSYGKKKELQLGEYLIGRGFKCKRFRGSRTGADLICTKAGKKWAIQVKATRKHKLKIFQRFTRDDRKRLKETADAYYARPVFAGITRNYFELRSIYTYKKLMSGTLKPLKGKHPEHK